MLAIIADEPYDINGRTSPFGGTTPITTPRLKKASPTIIKVSAVARYIEKGILLRGVQCRDHAKAGRRKGI